MNRGGYWPCTPNTNLLYALAESIDMLKMGLQLAGVRLCESGTLAAMDCLRANAARRDRPPRHDG